MLDETQGTGLGDYREGDTVAREIANNPANKGVFATQDVVIENFEKELAKMEAQAAQPAIAEASNNRLAEHEALVEKVESLLRDAKALEDDEETYRTAKVTYQAAYDLAKGLFDENSPVMEHLQQKIKSLETPVTLQ